jgi:serpin B
MKKIAAVSIVAVLAVLSALVLPWGNAAEAVKPDENAMKAAGDSNNFAFDLYKTISPDEKGNIFISPASISTALTMTYAGARGDTATGMKKALRLSLDDKDVHKAQGLLMNCLQSSKTGSKLSIANAIWPQKNFNLLKEFTDLLEKEYGAAPIPVDYINATEEARKTINTWVEKKTEDKIKELLKPGVLDPATRLVLTNAVHFKGTWLSTFDKKNTMKSEFYPSESSTVMVDMMSMREKKFKFLQNADLKVVELPYAEKKYSMFIILPSVKSNVRELEKTLASKQIETLTSGLRETKLETLAIPKFKITCEYYLSKHLIGMGMGAAFSGSADFSGMTGDKGINISEVVHKAFVDVNEEGTEAAAATAVVMKATAAMDPMEFIADRPFFFIIRENATGAVLFMGRIVDPTGGNAALPASDKKSEAPKSGGGSAPGNPGSEPGSAPSGEGEGSSEPGAPGMEPGGMPEGDGVQSSPVEEKPAMPAPICAECAKKPMTEDSRQCSCGGWTASGKHKMCYECARKAGVCAACGKPLK